MRLNDFLFLIKCSDGISLKNEIKLYQLVKHFSESELDGLSANEIVNLLKITARYSESFISSFNNQKRNFSPDFVNNQWLAINDSRYPEQLRESYLPPIGLFYQGNLQLLKTKMLGVVGSRTATGYSKLVLDQLIPELIFHNLTIVSGLAAGVDTVAHRLAIANGGKTIAVIGTGLAKYYPAENRAIQNYIGQHHLLLSECMSNVGPRRHQFPERKMIVAF